MGEEFVLSTQTLCVNCKAIVLDERPFCSDQCEQTYRNEYACMVHYYCPLVCMPHGRNYVLSATAD